MRTVVETGPAPHLGWLDVMGKEATCRAMAALEVLDIALLAEASLGQCRNLVPLVTFAFRITNGSSWRNRDLQRGRR